MPRYAPPPADTSAARVKVIVRNRIKLAQPAAMCFLIDRQVVNPSSTSATIEDLGAGVEYDVLLDTRQEHTFWIALEMRGQGHGLDGYRFAVSSRHTFKAADLARGRIEVTLIEYEGVELEQRPSVDWDTGSRFTNARQPSPS